MANSITQSRKSYTYAAGSSVLMFLFLAWIGILLLASNPNLEPSKLVHHVNTKKEYAFRGSLKAKSPLLG